MNKAMHWPARFEEMVQFVGLTEEELQLVKASSPIVMKHAVHLTDVIYDQFLQYPKARQYFVTADDQPDAKRIEANKQTVISWLRATAAAPSTEGFVRYLVGISQMHANTPIHRPSLEPVAPRYIIGTISYYQTAIAELLYQEMSDADLSTRTSIAWNKWLMVSLELQLAQYLIHDLDASE